MIYCKDHALIDHALEDKGFTWGEHEKSDLRILEWSDNGRLKLDHRGNVLWFDLPFRDRPSFENVMHCITCLLYLKTDPAVIQEGLQRLGGIKMRLELKKGVNNCYLIDDSYNNDLAGLQTALDFLEHQGKNEKKSVIFSDILESGNKPEQLYSEVAELIRTSNVQRFVVWVRG